MNIAEIRETTKQAREKKAAEDKIAGDVLYDTLSRIEQVTLDEITDAVQKAAESGKDHYDIKNYHQIITDQITEVLRLWGFYAEREEYTIGTYDFIEFRYRIAW